MASCLFTYSTVLLAVNYDLHGVEDMLRLFSNQFNAFSQVRVFLRSVILVDLFKPEKCFFDDCKKLFDKQKQ